MSTKLGVLTLDLVAKVGNFVGPMTQAEREARKASEGITDSFNATSMAVDTLKGAIAGLSVGALVAYGNQVIQNGVEIQRFATLTGQSVEEFQYFSKGAMTAGIQLDKYSDILKDVQDKVGDFLTTGGGEMADFFEKIAPKVNLTADAFRGLSGQDALQLYYSSLEKANITQAEAIFYMESIANDASLLIPLLQNGGAGFKKFGDEAQSAGAILSSATITEINQAKESLTMLGYQFEGIQSSLINNFVPALSMIAENFDVIEVAAGTLAVIVGGKLVWSLSLSAIQWAVNTAEVIRYQRALLAMAATTTTASQSVLMMKGIGGALLGVLGGPVGIGIAVASVAAGYALMRDNGEQANAMLAEQSKYASMSAQELRNLTGAQEKAAQASLATELSVQSNKLQAAKNDFEALTEEILDQNKASQEAYLVWAEFKSGVINADTAVSRLNKLDFVTPAQINALVDSRDKINSQETALGQVRVAHDAAGNSAQAAAGKVDQNSNALDGNASSAINAAKAQDEYSKSLNSSIFSNALALNLKNSKKFTDSEIKYIGQIAEAKRKAGAKVALSKEDIALAKEAAKYEDLRNKAFEKPKAPTESRKTDTQRQAERDAQRLADEVARIREQVAYAYASKEKQIEIDLQKELADIRKAGMDQTYIDRATNRAQVEKDLYQAQMDFEINEYKMTEQEKLRARLTIDQLTVTLDEQLTSKQLQGKLDAQKEAYLNEVQLLNLESAKRLADAQYYRNSELQNIAFQYEYERQQILLNKRLTEDERSTLVNESYRQQDRDVNDRRLDVELNYINAMGGDTSAEEDRMDRAQAIQDAYDWHIIAQDQYQAALLESQAQYERDRQDLAMGSMSVLLSATSATWSNMTSMIKDAAGEQSGIYKMMFLAQQAFAITSATINAFQAYNQILASPWHLDIVSKSTAASIVLGMGMANVGMIAAQTISGMAHNGIDNIPKEGTWLLDGGERVLNPQQNKDLTSYLENQNSGNGSGDVNITVQVTDSGVSAQSNQAEQKQLGMMIGNAVRAIIRQEKRQGGLLA